MFFTSFNKLYSHTVQLYPSNVNAPGKQTLWETNQAIVIMAVDKTQEAINVLKKNWVRTFGREIYAL